MENESIKLKLDESNNLTFEIKIEGDEAAVPNYRLVCETPGMGFTFYGKSDAQGVAFQVPAMKQFIKEGSYDTRLEVVLNDKLLIPMEFTTVFIAPTKITVEAVKQQKIIEQKPIAAQAKLLKNSVVQSDIKQKPIVKVVETKKQITQKKHVPTLSEMYREKKKS